jgi:inner membrane protease ATP23
MLSSFSEQECTTILGFILETSPRVKALISYIYLTGRQSLANGVTCRQCKGTTARKDELGYYDSGFKRIVICCNQMRSYRDVEETLVHELVHALDESRKGKLSILQRLACSEIRASVLGQCALVWPEVLKRKCVFRDAVASTSKHMGNQEAARVVSLVFENCYYDRTPFRSAQRPAASAS